MLHSNKQTAKILSEQNGATIETETESVKQGIK
jgi:hypothetical protein